MSAINVSFCLKNAMKKKNFWASKREYKVQKLTLFVPIFTFNSMTFSISCISSDFFLFDMQICSRILENKREGALLPHVSNKGQWFKYVIQYLRTTWNVHRSTILLKIVLHCKFAEQLAYETFLDDCFFVKCINFSYV